MGGTPRQTIEQASRSTEGPNKRACSSNRFASRPSRAEPAVMVTKGADAAGRTSRRREDTDTLVRSGDPKTQVTDTRDVHKGSTNSLACTRGTQQCFFVLFCFFLFFFVFFCFCLWRGRVKKTKKREMGQERGVNGEGFALDRGRGLRAEQMHGHNEECGVWVLVATPQHSETE